MSYVGRPLWTDRTTKTKKLDTLAAAFTGAQTVFNLTSSGTAVYPSSAQNVLVSLDGVIQEPGVDYTVSSSTITFTTAPLAGSTFFGVMNSEPYDIVLRPSVVTLNASSITTVDIIASGGLNGNGANVSSLNATAIASGTIGAAYLPSANATSNGAVNTAAQTFAGVKTFSANAAFSANVAITGDLTVNTSKFTVAANTGNSNVAGTLGVVGSIQTAGELRCVTANGTQAGVFLNQTNYAAWTMYTPAANNDLRFYNGSDRITFTSAGSVGFGTTSPAKPFEVSGSGTEMTRITGTGTIGSGIELNATGTGGRIFAIYSLANGAGQGGGKFLIRDNTGSADRITLDSNGKFGIGTTSPTYHFTLGDYTTANGSGTGIGTLMVEGNEAWVGWGDRSGQSADRNKRWGWYATGDKTYLYYVKSGANIITVDTNGYVGIGVTSPARPLDVAGSMKSTQWNITQALNQSPGPLSVSGTFTSAGGTLVIFTTGSGYLTSGSGVIGMNILIDTVNKGVAKTYTNETSSHKAFTCNFLVVTGIAAGSHTIKLDPYGSTVSDGNDFFSVTVMELPF